MGVPEQIKTDNGPAYTSERLHKFCQQWSVRHVTGIPRVPTGQAIVERANQMLKLYLAKFNNISDVQEKIAKTLYVLNYLCLFGDRDAAPAYLHSGIAEARKKIVKPFYVMYRHPATGIWQRPSEVQYTARGYMCVLTPAGPLWVPSRWTRAVTESDAVNVDTGSRSSPV